MRRSLTALFFLMMGASIYAPAATVEANLVIPCACEFPYLVDNGNGVNYELFIFEVPNYASVSQINGLTLRFDVFDDGVNDREESFKLVLDIPGPNLEVLTFLNNLGSNLGAVDTSTAFRVEHALTQPELEAILPSLAITDGFFVLRVNRLEGDFYINQAGATLDLESVPEPGTAMLLMLPMLLLAATARRRRDVVR